MSTTIIEVPDTERSTMIDALAREALTDLDRLKEQLDELTTRGDHGHPRLLEDCVSSSKLVADDLAAFRLIALAGQESRG